MDFIILRKKKKKVFEMELGGSAQEVGMENECENELKLEMLVNG